MKMHSTCLRCQFKNCPKEIPNELLNEEWAQHNHSQSLKRLNERGGMGIVEMLDNIHKRNLTGFTHAETQEDVDELNEIISKYINGVTH